MIIIKTKNGEVIDLTKVNAIGGATHYHDNYVPLIIVEAYGSEGVYNQYFTGDDIEGYDAHDSLIRWVIERPENFIIGRVNEIVEIRDEYGDYLEVDYKNGDDELETETIYYKIAGVHTMVHMTDNKFIRIKKDEYNKLAYPALYKD